MHKLREDELDYIVECFDHAVLEFERGCVKSEIYAGAVDYAITCFYNPCFSDLFCLWHRRRSDLELLSAAWTHVYDVTPDKYWSDITEIHMAHYEELDIGFENV